jgi:Rod binding domain-containing protein
VGQPFRAADPASAGSSRAEARLASGTPAPQSSRPKDTPDAIRDAAQQFEALLLAQILRAARGEGGWFGEENSASGCATEFAEQQFAMVMAQQGGLGLATLIASGLSKKTE